MTASSRRARVAAATPWCSHCRPVICWRLSAMLHGRRRSSRCNCLRRVREADLLHPPHQRESRINFQPVPPWQEILPFAAAFDAGLAAKPAIFRPETAESTQGDDAPPWPLSGRHGDPGAFSRRSCSPCCTGHVARCAAVGMLGILARRRTPSPAFDGRRTAWRTPLPARAAPGGHWRKQR